MPSGRYSRDHWTDIAVALAAAVLGLLWPLGCSEEAPTASRPAPSIWEQSNPAEQGMDQILLDSAFMRADDLGFVDGLLVIRNGYLVAERYYNGFTASTTHNVMSVSKSFLSAITGLAFEQGYLDSLEQRMLDYFPEYIYDGMEAAKYDVTIRHLLTMRMGLPGESANDYEEYLRLHNSPNWIKATLETPLAYPPGERMAYNTFETHLLSAIITKATGQSTLGYASAALFAPLKIDVDYWERDPQGYYFGGSAMCFTPREMAVLGWLYLNNGRLNDVQIVPSDWVELTLSPSTDFAHPNQIGELRNYNYAHLWWLGEIGGEEVFLGYGYGGQLVIAFPALNMVVVSTARNEVDPHNSIIQERGIFSLIARYIVPSTQ